MRDRERQALLSQRDGSLMPASRHSLVEQLVAGSERGRRRRNTAQGGFTLVELLVGMVIALLVCLAAAGGAQRFNAIQRQAMGAGGMTVNAGSVMAAMRDDIATAGLGFLGENRFVCDRLNFSVGTSWSNDGLSFTPIEIPGGTRASPSDTVRLWYASEVAGGANALLQTSTVGDVAEVRSMLPVSPGDAVLLSPPQPGSVCTVRTVSSVVPSTATTPQRLVFSSSGPNSTHNQFTFSASPTYPALDYPNVGRVTVLGSLKWVWYRVEGTNLVMYRPASPSTPSVVLLRNVMMFRAQFGVSAVGSNSIESWTFQQGAFANLTVDNMAQVRAVRIGVVTRSPYPEKPNPDGSCTATTVQPTIFGVNAPMDVPNWRCYRFRTTTMVVPLRNLTMGTSP